MPNSIYYAVATSTRVRVLPFSGRVRPRPWSLLTRFETRQSPPVVPIWTPPCPGTIRNRRPCTAAGRRRPAVHMEQKRKSVNGETTFTRRAVSVAARDSVNARRGAHGAAYDRGGAGDAEEGGRRRWETESGTTVVYRWRRDVTRRAAAAAALCTATAGPVTVDRSRSCARGEDCVRRAQIMRSREPTTIRDGNYQRAKGPWTSEPARLRRPVGWQPTGIWIVGDARARISLPVRSPNPSRSAFYRPHRCSRSSDRETTASGVPKRHRSRASVDDAAQGPGRQAEPSAVFHTDSVGVVRRPACSGSVRATLGHVAEESGFPSCTLRRNVLFEMKPNTVICSFWKKIWPTLKANH